MLARLQPGDGHRRMPVIRTGNRDGVHIFLLENPAEVLFRCRRLAHPALHSVGELLENVAVDIAHMRDAGRTLVRFQRREMRISASVQPDHREVEPIVGADDPFITPGSGSNSQPCRSHRHCL
jgi:hypothetical protein